MISYGGLRATYKLSLTGPLYYGDDVVVGEAFLHEDGQVEYWTCDSQDLQTEWRVDPLDGAVVEYTTAKTFKSLISWLRYLRGMYSKPCAENDALGNMAYTVHLCGSGLTASLSHRPSDVIASFGLASA